MATLQELIESEIADFFAGFGSPGEPENPEDMQSQLIARIAPLLASMEQEPVYFINKVVYADNYGDDVELKAYCSELDAMKSKSDFGGTVIPLYAVPQLPRPSPVSEADEISITEAHTEWMEKHLPRKTFSDEDWEEISTYTWLAWRDACRAAMLQGAEPVQAPTFLEWTNEQCLEFLSVAFRHNEISGDIEFDDIRLGVRFALAATPQHEVKK